ncbi:hypothetical protein V8E55_005953 [Tylopilus felleus]
MAGHSTSKSTKKEKIFHPDSRKAAQLTRTHLRKSKLAKATVKRSKKHAQQVLVSNHPKATRRNKISIGIHHHLCKPVLCIFGAHHVRYVRIQWVDLNNQVRCRVLPVTHFRKFLESDRPGVTVVKGALGVVVLQLAPGFSPVGEYVYVIDFSSFRPCNYAPGHAVFFGFFQEQVAIARPRPGLLFLKSVHPLVPVNDHQWSTTATLTTGTVEAQALEEIADTIQADGIVLEMYHSEGAPGQYEIVTGPLSPLEAADALVHTRETIYNIASKHGLRATLAPRLAADSSSELLTPVESAFLAGLMHHLPSIVAFTLPLTASYARVVDGIWSGGTWVRWGVDNREAPDRLTKAHKPSTRNFEIRPIDGTSNPYLAVASVLACGIISVRDNLELTVKNCDVARSAAQMSVEEREAFGITEKLPLDIDEARRCLATDDAIKSEWSL